MVDYQLFHDQRSKPFLRIHLTNVAGAGATQLLLSLLPALESHSSVQITEILLPDRGILANHENALKTVITRRYKRWLPNPVSRLLECLFLARRLDGETPLLVLGDLPLRCYAPQTVFVQTPHLLKPLRLSWSFGFFKYAIFRLVFSLNARYVDKFIVQTRFMQRALAGSYPKIADRIHVIAQPVPSWLIEAGIHRHGRREKYESLLKLIYPAAGYPHKNHKILSSVKLCSEVWPVKSLMLTIPLENDPAPNIPWVQCVGFLSAQEMIRAYSEVDGLLFLSTDESYGFPLLEAMFMGLPIVCPDLPYAHELCGDGAIYFDALSIDSLRMAIEALHLRLSSGWWPDWKTQLHDIPRDWNFVADQMISLACSLEQESSQH